MFLDEKNGPSFDLLAPAEPPRTFVIASLPRTGSSLLCRLLGATGQVGDPREYLNPMQVRDWQLRFGPTPQLRLANRLLRGRLVPLAGRVGWTEARLRDHLENIRLRRSSPDGWFGLKIHAHHFRRWFSRSTPSIHELLAPRAWFKITREDKVAQAVSWHRALISGRWSTEQTGDLPDFYDRSLIGARVRAIERDEAYWTAWFKRHGIEPLELRYEQLLRRPDEAIGRVFTHLGLQVPVNLPAAVPGRPQGDSTSAAWIDRYRAGR